MKKVLFVLLCAFAFAQDEPESDSFNEEVVVPAYREMADLSVASPSKTWYESTFSWID